MGGRFKPWLTQVKALLPVLANGRASQAAARPRRCRPRRRHHCRQAHLRAGGAALRRRHGARRASPSRSRQPRWCACSGPSGSGKTTLLRIAAGIEKPTGGRVLINDFEVAGPERFVPPEKRNVGLMFQDFALFPHLSIRDNVAFGLKSLPREEAAREALAALARVGLERYAGDFPHTLSGGEQQRVALARALAPRPAVMLMDEPFSGLDVQLRERLQEETLQLLQGDPRHLPDRHPCAGRGDPARRPHRRDAGGPPGAGRQGRGALPQPGRPVRRAAVLRDQRGPVRGAGRRAQDADRHLRGARP